MNEVRITDALTGGEKGQKPERYDLIPPHAMDEVARVFGYGVQKYADRNWEKGYDWGLSIAALHRHVKAFEKGESIDGESQCHHLASAVFHCLALMTYEKFYLGRDTRTKVGQGIDGLKFHGCRITSDAQAEATEQRVNAPSIMDGHPGLEFMLRWMEAYPVRKAMAAKDSIGE